MEIIIPSFSMENTCCARFELRKLYNLDHFGDELFLQQQQNILLKKTILERKTGNTLLEGVCIRLT